jgi:hypothetical protein
MNIYAISNLDAYADEMRVAAANSISKDYSENLDDFITIHQLKNLIKQYSSGIDEQDRVILDDDAIDDIFYATADWIYGVALSRLASKNLIECAWDDEENNMVFWVSHNGENDEPKSRSNNTNSESN